MNKTETLQLLAILKAAYPNTFRDQTKEEATGTVNVWCVQFADTPAKVVMMAVQKLISTNKFPPTIAEVKAKLSSMHWESYQVIHSQLREFAPPEHLRQCEAVYAATSMFADLSKAEPSLASMLGSPGAKMIGGSNNV